MCMCPGPTISARHTQHLAGNALSESWLTNLAQKTMVSIGCETGRFLQLRPSPPVTKNKAGDTRPPPKGYFAFLCSRIRADISWKRIPELLALLILVVLVTYLTLTALGDPRLDAFFDIPNDGVWFGLIDPLFVTHVS